MADKDLKLETKCYDANEYGYLYGLNKRIPDEEFEKAKPKGVIQRNKGLGSLSADQARRSMFTEEFQRMDQLLPDEDSLYLLSQLMGKDSEPKRNFVFENVDFSEIRE